MKDFLACRADAVALNELQSEGLIQLERGRIYIPALENLIKR